MTGAEFYGLNKNYDRKNTGCTDWKFDSSYGATFGREAEKEYIKDIKKDGKTCGHCLWADIGFCTFTECYPERIEERRAVST